MGLLPSILVVLINKIIFQSPHLYAYRMMMMCIFKQPSTNYIGIGMQLCLYVLCMIAVKIACMLTFTFPTPSEAGCLALLPLC